ncbi:chloramphenicol phosphotransferase CPT family protein [Falsibacillus pallidus]|uniref:chloramphenicol phosphotransferase CPT family protein n=1 Tax=Falsibacillus pallidus TaxID=493781 RepID=UPI003D96549B
MIDVIILNGGSSSGKTTLAKCLQKSLSTPWLRFSIDDLIAAMPEYLLKEDTGIQFGEDGSVIPGTEFRKLESAWMQGIAEMARNGAQVIIDDVFISGAAAQNRWKEATVGLQILWVGVYCDQSVAASRENSRGDRVEGMAVSQASLVHEGIYYDLKIDTTNSPTEECAQIIIAEIGQ